jgi:hypothetical protein
MVKYITSIGECYIESCSALNTFDNPLDKLWLIVKSQQLHLLKRITHDLNNGTEVLLKRGDIIKLGRAILKVSELNFGESEDKVKAGTQQDKHLNVQATKIIPE